MSDLNQLKDYCDYLDEMQRDLDFSLITDPASPTPISAEQSPNRNIRKGWLAATAAAAAVLVLVGGMAALTRIQQESQIAPVAEDPTPIETDTPVAETVTPDEDPVAEPAEPPVVQQSEPVAPRLAINVPAGVESGTIDTPLGPARWVHLPWDGATPHNAEAIPWPSGFAVFTGFTYDFATFDPSSGQEPAPVPAALWVSDDGVEWSTIPLPVPATAEGASLNHVDGAYWLELKSFSADRQSRLWRSPDAVNWEELDFSNVGPEPAALYGPMGPGLPASSDDVTVMSARFDATFPLTKFAVGAGEGECASQVGLQRLGPDRFRIAKGVGEGEGPYCPPQPVLRMVETEAGLDVLVDETGENLGTIEGADLDDMDLVVGDDLDGVKRLVIMSDGEITSIDLPWPTYPTLFGTADFVYAYVSDFGKRVVWRTENGTDWTDLGPVNLPEVSGENSELTLRELSDGRLVAWHRGPLDEGWEEAWESVDGINWEQVKFGPLPQDLTSNPDAWKNPLRPMASRWVLKDGVGLWVDFGGEWVSLADLDPPQPQGYELHGITGYGNTIYIETGETVTFTDAFGGNGGFNTSSLWIVNLEPTE